MSHDVHDAETEASHPTPLRAAPRDRPAEADRAQQLRLLAALGAWDRALRRDDCSAWCISGKTGSIHTWGDGRTWACSSSAARPGTGRIRSSASRSAPSPRTATTRAACGCTSCPPRPGG